MRTAPQGTPANSMRKEVPTGPPDDGKVAILGGTAATLLGIKS